MRAAGTGQLSRYLVTEERITQELALLAFSNMGDYVRKTKDGLLVADFSAVTPEQMAAVGEVTIEQLAAEEGEPPVNRVKFKLSDKRASLEALGKRFEAFRDRPAPPADAAALAAAVDARLAEIFGDALRKRAARTIEGEKSA